MEIIYVYNFYILLIIKYLDSFNRFLSFMKYFPCSIITIPYMHL